LPPHEFAYELRERDSIVSLGRLILESDPEVGQTIPINGMLAAIVEIVPGPRLILSHQRGVASARKCA
jgi:hypothetical protein